MTELRALFLPDLQYTLLDCDYVKADFHVVVWESAEAALKELLRSGKDIYTEMTHGLVSYKLAKRFAHACNYGATAKVLAQNCGLKLREAEAAQQGYFSRYPGIPRWHNRVRQQLRVNPPRVRNAFGYQRTYLGIRDEASLETTLKEALAWIGQSTVACVTNRAMLAIDEQLPWCTVLLHNHDALLLEAPTAEWRELWPEIERCMMVPVPYPEPLVIPVECKASLKSWADVRGVA